MSEQAASMNTIVHVLFIDIVGYSRENVGKQAALIQRLTAAIQATPTYSQSKSPGQVHALATGDGSAIVFTNSVDSPAKCALELVDALGDDIPVRMGIHSGLVQLQSDINGQVNFAGEGINTAQRVMDFGQAGHVLMSGQYASWLTQFSDWQGKVKRIGLGTAKHGQKVELWSLFTNSENYAASVEGVEILDEQTNPGGGLDIVILYKRNAQPDDTVLAMLEDSLTKKGHAVFVDRHLKIGVEWAKAIESKIRLADAVVAILSDTASSSEMLEYELETAFDENRKRGKPFLLPVRVGTDRPVDGPLGAFVNSLNFSVWLGVHDNQRVVTEILSAATEPPATGPEEIQLEPVGGAMSPDSPFYLERPSDAEFLQAIQSQESIILVKGPRQMGKTSMIGRGVSTVHKLGWRTVTTDFQKLSTSQLSSEDAFYRLLGATMARRMNFTYDFGSEWLEVFGANMNLDNFLRAALESSPVPFVWFMDEADKLFGVPFASDFFGLVRSWHNCRATEPDGPWKKMTIVIGYATEAHLFIQDLNQSPFNVGRQLDLQNFALENIEDLNRRCDTPVSSQDDVKKVYDLVEGQPFLSRRAFDVLGRKAMGVVELIEKADREDGPFGDHLKRILVSVSQMPSVLDALRASLSNPELRDTDGYHRLLAAGIVQQTGDRSVRLRCELYRRYLSQHI